MKLSKISFIISLCLLLCFSNILGIHTSRASQIIDKANLYSKGECGSLLKKDGTIIKVTYVVYNKDGKDYPAYCLDKVKPGVGEVGEYSVNLEGVLKNTSVWRVIINGYPYQTPGQLGCLSEQEAYTATKMAVYSMLYDYTFEQFSSIGEAGERTLQALERILTNASKSTSQKVSPDLIITEETKEWQIEQTNPKYVFKQFKVTSNGPMPKYTVELEKGKLEEALLTDMQGQIKQEFDSNEKFKVLLPISQLTQAGQMKIKATSQVETKPIFIGKAPNSSYQDYAITGIMIEEGKGEKTIPYEKNETKLKIYKKDKDGNIPLPNAHFDLYDDKHQLMFSDLISNEQGEIILSYLMPGTYYLKETKAPNEYLLYESDIRLEIGFNEELSLIVHNEKENVPTIEIEKVKKEVKIKSIETKLPKTGM